MQPPNVGVAIHWASVGRDGGAVYSEGFCVTTPDSVPVALIVPPANKSIVEPVTFPSTVSELVELA